MIERFETFTTNIASLYKNIVKIKKYEMNKIGLKGTHVTCMNFLNNSPEGLTAAEICVLAKENKAGISRALADLLEQGLVEYVNAEDTSDKRKYRAKVILTPKGIAYAQKVNVAINNAVSFGGSDLSDETRAVFYSALKTISANLEQYCNELERNDDHE